ncbi:MAG: hypothetical protein IT424_15265 [Pirellulales bacterium]|nr:hypothetical protein [Pirellulales bacterium]
MNPTLRVAAAGALMIWAASAAPAAPVPYSEGFEGYATGDTAVANFTETAPEAWGVASPSYSGQAYENVSSVFSSGPGFAVLENSSAGIAFPALGSSTFSMSTTFRIDSLTLAGSDPNNTATIGLFARSATVNPAATGSDRYHVSYSLDDDGLGHATGRLWLREVNLFFSDSLNELSAAALPVTLGDVYRMSFSGVESGGSVALSASLINLSTSARIDVTDADSSHLLSHSYFGYFNHVRVEDGGTVSLNADFDDFSMVIPEPEALAFALAAGVVAIAVRRRPLRAA